MDRSNLLTIWGSYSHTAYSGQIKSTIWRSYSCTVYSGQIDSNYKGVLFLYNSLNWTDRMYHLLFWDTCKHNYTFGEVNFRFYGSKVCFKAKP